MELTLFGFVFTKFFMGQTHCVLRWANAIRGFSNPHFLFTLINDKQARRLETTRTKEVKNGKQ